VLQYFNPPPVRYDDLALKKCWRADWTIHGWWPEHNRTSWPQFCNPRRYHLFNATELEEKLGGRMWNWWSPCPEWKIDPVKFWRHEWEKHGTCTPDSPLQYFGRTLDLFEAAQGKSWYGCCGQDDKGQCLLHFNKTTDKWLGVC
jgi:hypothetical protein